MAIKERQTRTHTQSKTKKKGKRKKDMWKNDHEQDANRHNKNDNKV